MQIPTKYSSSKNSYFEIKSSLLVKLSESFMFSFFIVSSIFAQNKEIRISRTDIPPRIDGKLNDSVWETCVK